MEKRMAYWGFHAMFDCASCDIDKVTSKENVHNFIKELVPAIEMIAFGEPMIEHFATHAPDKAGISFLQMIETSNISGHLVDSNGDAYIDIFSCKTVDVKVAEDLISKYFNPKKIRLNFITRSAG
jgi:S-adenosylmethionine/arginine decarboxylase-like enzyme